MKLTVKKTAALADISIRTLHYYDEIGLLKPSDISTSGYRLYDDEDINRLMQILFFKELGFSLKDISDMMSNPDYDKNEALKKHKQLLILKKEHISRLIALTEQAIGGKVMEKDTEKIQQYEKIKEQYANEAKQKWGKTDAYNQSLKKHDSYNSQDKIKMMKESEEIFKSFAQSRNLDPKDEKVQNLVKRWQDYITKYSYDCTKQILSSLAVMYTEDERFKANIDKYGEGTAKFMSDAIMIYCKD